jgi:type II secretory pathway component PulL
MSAKSRWILSLNRGHLDIARVTPGVVERAEAIEVDYQAMSVATETIAGVLERQGYAGEPVLLALGSGDVVSTTVANAAGKAFRRAALAFLVEPALPWSVEDSVIDFEPSGTSSALVVASEAAPLRKLISGLQERGICIASVTPLSRLGLAEHLAQSRALAPHYALIWGHGDTADVWLVENDRPVLWRWVPFEIPAVAQTLTQIALCEHEDFVLVGRNLPDRFLASLHEQTGLESVEAIPLDSEDLLDCAAQQAAAVLAGRCDAPLELCRDQLAPADRRRSIRRELRALQGAALLLIVVLGVAAGFKARQVEALRAECDTRRSELFQELFPKEKVPVAVNTRLQSEATRLKGVRGESTDLPQVTPYLGVLERLLQALPESLRFRLLEVRIENGRLYVVGQVRAHGDADRIADGLRAAGLEVGAPNTNRLEKEGVEFRISAHVPTPPSKKPTRRPA